jgi:hypothetical protein
MRRRRRRRSEWTWRGVWRGWKGGESGLSRTGRETKEG